ncbi:hypothetical protein BHM03_00024490 [Ensete ventricosum]|nr:hypothetical protein BHM03_00024490 [Ensete ventricosum]
MVTLGELRGMSKVSTGQSGPASRMPSTPTQVQEVPVGTTVRVADEPTPKRSVVESMPCAEDLARLEKQVKMSSG